MIAGGNAFQLPSLARARLECTRLIAADSARRFSSRARQRYGKANRPRESLRRW